MNVENFKFNVVPTEEYTNITKDVQGCVDLVSEIRASQKLQGLALVYTKHTTACVRLLEPEVLLKQDMHDFMERLAPSTVKYRHDDIEHRDVPPEERLNGFSHLRAMMLNHQELIPIVDGKLDLGKWQNIFYVECDLGKEDRTWNLMVIDFN